MKFLSLLLITCLSSFSSDFEITNDDLICIDDKVHIIFIIDGRVESRQLFKYNENMEEIEIYCEGEF